MSFNTDLLDQAIAKRRHNQEQQRQKILAQVINWLETVGGQQGIERAYIFGSSTRPGDFTETSDVDIAVSGKLPQEFCALISFLATTVEREVDLIHLEKCHFSDRIRDLGILWTKMP